MQLVLSNSSFEQIEGDQLLAIEGGPGSRMLL